jgi:rod shape-determining protein MreD
LKQSLWHHLDLIARNLVPVALTTLLVMAGVVPLGLPDLSPIFPALALIAVYYWTVHRPDLMPVWAVFLIGLFQDLLSGGPVGVGVAALLVVHGMVVSLRRYFGGASLFALWLVFAPVAGAAIFTLWLLTCLLRGALLDPEPAAFQYLATMAAYPCLAWLFAQAHRAFLR